jgi:hypothetical protein
MHACAKEQLSEPIWVSLRVDELLVVLRFDDLARQTLLKPRRQFVCARKSADKELRVGIWDEVA